MTFHVARASIRKEAVHVPVVALLVLTTAACAARGHGNLPAHVVGNGGPTGVLQGTLQSQGPCVVIRGLGDLKYLVIWPDGYSLVGDKVLDEKSVQVANLGSPIEIYGGELRADKFSTVAGNVTVSVPDACRSELYWIADDVARASPSS